jgi:hypothetical protein
MYGMGIWNNMEYGIYMDTVIKSVLSALHIRFTFQSC